jgi:hypothetical protein
MTPDNADSHQATRGARGINRQTTQRGSGLSTTSSQRNASTFGTLPGLARMTSLSGTKACSVCATTNRINAVICGNFDDSLISLLTIDL